jgi:hypothetical protein
MQVSYSILFDIQLLHEYFSNKKSRDVVIVPADDCLQFFKGAHILWRNTDSRYFALMRENKAHEPFINTLPEDGSPSQKLYREYFKTDVFRFYLQAKSHLFFNYTNTGNVSGKQVFYFSNLAANKRADTYYLSRPVNDHVTGKEYLPGNLVAQPGTDNVFEAIRKHTSTNVSELSNASLWALKGQLQYPTEHDLIEYSAGNYLFVLSAPATTAQISFFSFNYDDAAPAYDVPVGATVSQVFAVAQTEVTINLSTLNPGKYLVQVNGESRMVYYDPLLASGYVLGIIEIFNHLPGTNEYALLTADEVIKGMSYTIQFPTRRVLWKYIRKDSKAQAITDTGSTGYTFPLHVDEFVSATPIPLSEVVLETLELTFSTADFKLHPLPNPSVQRLGRFTQNGYDYLCSEIFLNY